MGEETNRRRREGTSRQALTPRQLMSAETGITLRAGVLAGLVAAAAVYLFWATQENRDKVIRAEAELRAMKAAVAEIKQDVRRVADAVSRGGE